MSIQPADSALPPMPAAQRVASSVTPAEHASDARENQPSAAWLRWHWLLPACLFVLANLLLIVAGGDRLIADQLYAWEGGRWALQDSFLTSTVVHEIGRQLSLLALTCLIATTIVVYRNPGRIAWRAPLLRLLLSLIISTITIAILKRITHMDCPWDLQAYGGHRPYIGLFTLRPDGLRASGCFPAGHASAGYGWVALYFFFLVVKPRWRWLGLGIGLAVGALFGISQQLRGAHFMSHDAWTLMICWSTALLLYRARLGPSGAQLQPAGIPEPLHQPDKTVPYS